MKKHIEGIGETILRILAMMAVITSFVFGLIAGVMRRR
jgi:hypothetical protein